MVAHTKRIAQVVERIQETELSHVLVSSIPNLLYLTGQRLDTGERMTALLLSPYETPTLYIHEMFADRVNDRDMEGIRVVFWSDGMSAPLVLGKALPENSTVGVDANWPSTFLLELMAVRPHAKFVASRIVERLREVKDADEIQVLRQASRIADAVVHEMMQLQALPTSERQMAENARGLFMEHNVWALAFEPIICFGPNSANPHHSPTGQWLHAEQAITIDIGGVFHNYCSDITRTAFYGKGNPRFSDVYSVVLEAHLQALDLIKPGMRFSELDLFIRNQFARRGLDQYFIHRTGHGLGLEAHEGPFVHQYNQDPMEEGMVITVEPGIYLPGEFGVRIEDVVVVTSTGCEVLTQSSRDVKYLDAINA